MHDHGAEIHGHVSIPCFWGVVTGLSYILLNVVAHDRHCGTLCMYLFLYQIETIKFCFSALSVCGRLRSDQRPCIQSDYIYIKGDAIGSVLCKQI